MDSKYRPGLVSASLSRGKTKAATNPFLEQLFSKKPVTEHNQKKESENVVSKKSKKKKSVEIKSQSPSREKVEDDVTVSNKKRKKIPSAEKAETKIKLKRKKLTEETETKIKSKKLKAADSNGVREDFNPNNVEKKTTTGKRKKPDDPVITASTPSPKKMKKISSDQEDQEKKSTNKFNDFPYVHESILLQQKGPQKKKGKGLKRKIIDDEEDIEMSTRNKNRRDKTADPRTVFIGNCPLSADKKVMTKLFREYGAIESIRFRCGPVAKLEIPKRAAVILKEFHENANSYICYIVFKEEESAKKALEKNGHVLNGFHLRVDIASNFKKHDKKRSVFVGNLTFTATEEDLRSHFEDCGVIVNVRVVRDRQTSIGKGIAYVQFESKDGVTLAKKLNNSEFDGRRLRVMTCTNKPKADKSVDKSGRSKRPNQTSRPPPTTGKRKVNFAPSNRSSSKSFLEMLQAKKDKRLSKIKKKRANSQKSDGLSSIFGDMTADMKKLKEQNPKLRDKKVKDKKKVKAKEKKSGKGQKKER